MTNSLLTPDKSTPASPQKTSKRPFLILPGSVVLVLAILGMIFFARLHTNTSTPQTSTQLYVTVNDNSNGANRLNVLDGRDGHVVWSHADIYPDYIPQIVDDTVVVVDHSLTTVSFLNAADGSLRWSWQGATYGIGSEYAYMSTLASPRATSTVIQALDIHNGHKKWQTSITKGAKFMLAGDRPYVVNGTNGTRQSLAQLDPQTGAQTWQTTLSYADIDAILGPLNGLVFANDAKKLYAFDTKTGNIAWTIPPPTHFGVGVVLPCGNMIVCIGYFDGSVSAVNITSGAVQWRYTLAPVILNTGAPDLQIAIVDDANFVIVHNTQNIVAIRKSDGSVAWKKMFADDTEPTNSSSAPYPLGNGMLYVLEAMSTDMAALSPTMVLALDATTGKTAWQTPYAYDQFHRPTLIGNIVVAAKDTVVTALNARTGKELWHRDNKFGATNAHNGHVEFITGAPSTNTE